MNYPNTPAGLLLFMAALRKAAPSIAFSIHWEHDEDAGPIHKECDGFTAAEADEWQAWQSEVRAECIIDGETRTGSDYLGGTFEKADDVPEESNPFISGYLPDMIDRALDELAAQIGSAHADEITAARQVLQDCRLTAADEV